MPRIKYYNKNTKQWEYADSAFQAGQISSTAYYEQPEEPDGAPVGSLWYDTDEESNNGGNVDLTGVVKSVNGQTPDENGNVEISVSGGSDSKFDELFEPIYGESSDDSGGDSGGNTGGDSGGEDPGGDSGGDSGDEPETGVEIPVVNLIKYAKETADGKHVIKKSATDKWLTVGANVEPNTDYKFTASGGYNRFRVYGTQEIVDLEAALSASTGNQYVVEEIYKDDDTISEYTLNSGNYRTVFVYLVSGIALSNLNIVCHLYDVSDGSAVSTLALPAESTRATTQEVVGYRAKLPIDMKLPATNVTAGAFKWLGFHPWVLSETPSTADEAAYGYENFINNIYEPLRAEYPSYITRSVIGRDESDTYDIYQYTLCPDYPEQTIYLQSGVHGNEPDAWIGLANTIRAICNNWDSHPGLAYLRWACRICIVPIVNPYGMQNRTRRNSTSTDLNRNTVSRSQSETVAVCNYFEEMNELYGFNFALDYHTTAMDVAWGGDCAIGIHEDSKSIDIVKRVGIMFAKRFSHDRLPSYLTAYGLGKEDLYLPYFCKNETDGTFEDLFYLHSVPGSTVEWSDGIYASTQTTEFTMRGATELIGTQIIQHAEAKFGILL